jgi:hypothetical protein
VGRIGEGALKGMLVGYGGCLRSFLSGKASRPPWRTAVVFGGGWFVGSWVGFLCLFLSATVSEQRTWRA